MEYIESSILKTLLYSDIFDFPLRKEELWEYLVSGKAVSKKEFEKAIEILIHKKRIICGDGYYCLAGRIKNIQKRKKNLPEISKKIKIAQKAARYIAYIPTIQFVGISGGLAMNDADEEDDIDFFIITKRKTLFVSRILILGLLQILKLRRKRLDQDPADKICVNFMIDEEKLNFTKNQRDIYIAHEIAQLKPLFERDQVYLKFTRANKWVKKFFPNVEPQNHYFMQEIVKHDKFKAFIFLLNFSPLTNILKWVQIRYLQQHQTIEKVSDRSIAFHPNDYRVQTLKQMNLKLRQLGLLTNS